MTSPMIPEDEKQRLEKLRALKILDSAPEERFDRLTRMDKRMFGVDISVLSLIDDGRQCFKSKASERVIQRFNNEVTNYNQAAARGYDIEYSVGLVNSLVGNEMDIHGFLAAADKKMYADKGSNVR
tara:strand:+ start:2826 stop:3203 length:378 start_codon:yes stop_codon:yes gene_type:complete